MMMVNCGIIEVCGSYFLWIVIIFNLRFMGNIIGFFLILLNVLWIDFVLFIGDVNF